MANFLHFLNDIVWGPATVILIFAVGIILSFKTRFIQVFHLKKAFHLIFEKDGSKGDISPFASLCTSLSATIGTGNIIGVAAAVNVGGPGAIFWMMISAFFGMATKYAEGFLAVKYRKHDSCGTTYGGPFYYIEEGLKQKFGKRFSWRWLGCLFSLFTVFSCLLGMGTMVQSNSIAAATQRVFRTSSSAVLILTSLMVTFLTALVIFGGGRLISKVSQITVPFMAAAYLFFSFLLIFFNIEKLLPSIKLILVSAFNTKAVLGAASGVTLSEVIRIGISRGIFTNESGLGSAPIAAASAKTDSPVKMGLVTMTGTFIDTFVLCLISGICIVMTGSYIPSSKDGFSIAALSWKSGLPFSGDVCVIILSVCLIFFAFTTIIGWNFYAEKCLFYLLGKENKLYVRLFRILYVLAVAAGPFLTANSAFLIADIFNGLMAFPNLFALLLLSNTVKQETREYLKKC